MNSFFCIGLSCLVRVLSEFLYDIEWFKRNLFRYCFLLFSWLSGIWCVTLVCGFNLVHFKLLVYLLITLHFVFKNQNCIHLLIGLLKFTILIWIVVTILLKVILLKYFDRWDYAFSSFAYALPLGDLFTSIGQLAFSKAQTLCSQARLYFTSLNKIVFSRFDNMSHLFDFSLFWLHLRTEKI